MKIAKLLMEKSSEFNINLSLNWECEWHTAFHIACYKGDFKMADMLLMNTVKFNMDINAKICKDKKTAFHLACQKGHTDIVELFFQKSAELEIGKEIYWFGFNRDHYTGAKKDWHPYYINTIEMRSL